MDLLVEFRAFQVGLAVVGCRLHWSVWTLLFVWFFFPLFGSQSSIGRNLQGMHQAAVRPNDTFMAALVGRCKVWKGWRAVPEMTFVASCLIHALGTTSLRRRTIISTCIYIYNIFSIEWNDDFKDLCICSMYLQSCIQ